MSPNKFGETIVVTNYPAFPLLLMSLDAQIKRRGGKGFTCDVVAKPIQSSYSVVYEFDTPTGKASITTLNEFQLGVIHTENGHVYVMFRADKNEYFKVTIKPAIRVIGQKILFTTPIAKTFAQSMEILKRWYPTHTNWNLTAPPII